MRLFVAINLSDMTRSRLVSMRDELREDARRGNFTRAENIHLTLVFIGECTDAQASAAKAAMYETKFEPFTMTIDHIGQFRRYGAGCIWWAGVRECKPLEDLHHELMKRMIAKGITADERKYSPHITFGRDVVTKKGPWAVEPFFEDVNAIDLMVSERIDGKLTYTSIYRKRAGE